MLLLLTRLATDASVPVKSVAVAAGAAVMVTFVLDIGRIVVRSARRDLSARFFASATQRFLLILTGTVLLALMAMLGQFEWVRSSGVKEWFLLGAGMAFLGDRAALTVRSKLAGALKVSQAAVNRDGLLGRIDGMSDETAERLSEEGISDVHALAFHSTPRLFVSTPYTLMELCDWQDQALLHVRLGPTRAAICREQLLVRGATELHLLARDHVRGELSEERTADLVKLLGLPSEVQLHALMHQVATDAVVTRLAVYRDAVPEVPDKAEAGG